MWKYFFFCLFASARIKANGNTTTIRAEKNNATNLVSNSTSIIHTTSTQSWNRRGHERDVLVVLPVMQGNSELTNSNLQMLYTKTPVTAIINEQPELFEGHQIQSTKPNIFSSTASVITSTSTTTTTTTSTPRSRIVEKHINQPTTAPPPHKKRDDSRHPFTDFLFMKPMAPKIHKTPLDYGYPESFKFVQELNELPKNHKPEWAQSDIIDTEVKRTTSSEKPTKGDPFQMFESVKPLEINKLLSLKPIVISVTDSIVEETVVKKKQESTEAPYRLTKRPVPYKRPSKKPQKIKLNPQKLSEAELAPFIAAGITIPPEIITTPIITSTTSTPSNLKVPGYDPTSPTNPDNELYTAARYSTLFAESTKAFLPTPYLSTPDRIATVIRPIETKSIVSINTPPATTPTSTSLSTTTTSIASTIPTTVSTTTTPTSTTTTSTSSTTISNNWFPITSLTTTTTLTPNFNWTNTNNLENNIPQKNVAQIKPSDLVSLTKILDEHFNLKNSPYTLPNVAIQTTTSKPPFPADMLTNDMKNMLVALGILKSEQDSSPPPLLFATSTIPPPSSTERFLFETFTKREPVTPAIDPNSYISFKKLPIGYDRPKVNDDMRDLLSSFGLLPNSKLSPHLDANSILTRISRQQRVENDNTSNTSMEMLNSDMRATLENLGLLKPMAYSYQPERDGHVFQPSIHLEKLTDRQQVDKIHNALQTIRALSKSKDVQNLPIEELEQKLQNVTALLQDDKLIINENITQILNSTDAIANTTTAKIPETTETTNSSTIKSTKINRLTYTTPASYIKNNTKINLTTNRSTRKRSSTSPTITSTIAITSTIKSNSKEEINDNVETWTTDDISIYNKSTENSLLLPQNDINYTSDASSVSFIELTRNNESDIKLTMSPPPNPLSIEELQNLLEMNRNDVKRQQPPDQIATTTIIIDSDNKNNSSAEDVVSSSNIDDSISNNTTNNITDSNSSDSTHSVNTNADSSIKEEQQNSAPLEALADSFGGENEEQTDNWQPNAKPNGLYFLLDWNTFLSVGEEDKNPVRIRFSPRAGNPRNFLPIRVP